MSELFGRIKKGWSMAKCNKVVYRDVPHLFWGFLLIALIFCGGSSVYADDGDGSNKSELVRRYVSESLLFYNELASESGIDFVKARRVHADLLSIYLKARKADYVNAVFTDEVAKGFLKDLESIKNALERDIKNVPEAKKNPNAWAKGDIKEASERLHGILMGFEPYLETPFDLAGFEVLGVKCRDDLGIALSDVKAKLRVYIQHLTAEKADNHVTVREAEKLCEANRRGIVLLFLARFADFEGRTAKGQPSKMGLGLKALRQFRGDINRTIYWNRILEKRLKGSDEASVLAKYSASELRRLRVLRAVLNRDMREAQYLLLVAFKKSVPLKTTSDEK